MNDCIYKNKEDDDTCMRRSCPIYGLPCSEDITKCEEAVLVYEE